MKPRDDRLEEKQGSSQTSESEKNRRSPRQVLNDYLQTKEVKKIKKINVSSRRIEESSYEPEEPEEIECMNQYKIS